MVEENHPQLLPHVHAPLQRVILPEQRPCMNDLPRRVRKVQILYAIARQSAPPQAGQGVLSGLTATSCELSKTRSSAYSCTLVRRSSAARASGFIAIAPLEYLMTSVLVAGISGHWQTAIREAGAAWCVRLGRFADVAGADEGGGRQVFTPAACAATQSPVRAARKQ